MEKIILLLLLIIITLLIAIYRKLYWIKIDVRKTDNQKEAELKQEISEIGREMSVVRDALKETEKIEDIKKREETQKKIWKRFLSGR